jgi:hypothetical protein
VTDSVIVPSSSLKSMRTVVFTSTSTLLRTDFESGELSFDAIQTVLQVGEGIKAGFLLTVDVVIFIARLLIVMVAPGTSAPGRRLLCRAACH